MVYYIFFSIACFLWGAFKGLSDKTLFYDGYLSGNDWKNKWKLTPAGELIQSTRAPWYYLGLYTPEYVEKFPYSSTFLVAFTDRWHRFQLLERLSVVAAIFCASKINIIFAVAAALVLYSVGFLITFKK